MVIINSNRKVITLLLLVFLISSTYIYILLFVEISPQCVFKSESCSTLDLLIKSIKNIPAWVGSLVGIFASSWLAFNFNINKQTLDDIKNKTKENEKRANNTIMHIDTCLDDLLRIKDHYFFYLQSKDDNSQEAICRSLNWPRIIIHNFEKVTFKTTDSDFLVNLNKFNIEIEPISSIYIYELSREFNSVIFLLNEREKLFKEFEDFFKISLRNEDYNYYSSEFSKFGLNKIYNLIFLSETIFQRVDSLILKYYYLSYEYPEYCKKHFDNELNNNKNGNLNFTISRSIYTDDRVNFFNKKLAYFDDIELKINYFLNSTLSLSILSKIRLEFILLKLRWHTYLTNKKQTKT
ncbi:hypothetical protein [Photobacterium phosphoreum]|uniref:hypothetical protein n=1 Tax=Photobacterium phosphoreum TaxID=659 RepID=UPI0039AFEA98